MHQIFQTLPSLSRSQPLMELSSQPILRIIHFAVRPLSKQAQVILFFIILSVAAMESKGVLFDPSLMVSFLAKTSSLMSAGAHAACPI